VHEAGQVAVELVAETALTAEVLPLRVHDPALNDCLVAERVPMLEVQKRDHQPAWQHRSAGRELELRGPMLCKRLASRPSQPSWPNRGAGRSG